MVQYKIKKYNDVQYLTKHLIGVINWIGYVTVILL